MKGFLVIAICLLPGFLDAQVTSLKAEKSAGVIDTAIASLVREISADSIKDHIVKLAGFKTRHSLSDTASADEGIGAARRWVASRFRQYADRNSADMSVYLDPFIVTPSPRHPRVPYTVTMKNVVATLKGTDGNDSRVIIVSGHLDSRNSDVMDSVGRAPGANDDASGVAVVMELARVMSKRKFPCTILFMAVSVRGIWLQG
jgi:Zn-dependent M28 family amino/carboxypeptidase